MANPTPASAAASAMENRAKTWPFTLGWEAEKATRLMLALLSKSSMHIISLIPFFWVTRPYKPMVNIAEASSI